MNAVLPQHPVHYAFGCTTHAPSVFEAWVNEQFNIKAKYFFLYLYFMGFGGYASGQFGLLDMAGLYIMIVGIMSIPIYVLSENKSFLDGISNAFFNGVLAFHGFFISFFIIYNFIFLTSMYLDAWSPSMATLAMSIGMVLMTSFSLQMAATINHRLPWAVVWIFSLILGLLAMHFLAP